MSGLGPCPKCGRSTGDGWEHCEGSCPLWFSPFYDPTIVHSTIEKLRAELASGSFYKEEDIDKMENTVEALKAEVERQRADVARLHAVLRQVGELCHEIQAGDASAYEALDIINEAIAGGGE